ncbi:MAG TPA: hypothetical protein VNE39_26045 [Planctomycetota bacterium]|nr:hypothetical protein [Planctomycetota bacterium]
MSAWIRCLAALGLVTSLAAGGQRPRAPRPEPPPKPDAAPQKLATTHFDLEFTVPPGVAKGYAALCERAYGRFCDLLNVPDGEVVWEGKCKVLLLATREQFLRVAVAIAGPAVAMSGGFARPTKRAPLIVMPLYGQERVRLEQVVIHEMTHIFLQLYRKEVNLPTWLQEGSAQFFEFMHHAADSRLKQWQATVKALVAAGTARPLREFWVASFPPTDRAGYAQAWSLIHYLSQCPKTKGKIGKFVLKLKELVPERRGFVHIRSEADLAPAAREAGAKAFAIQADAFQQVFGMTVDDFERSWQKFVLATY